MRKWEYKFVTHSDMIESILNPLFNRMGEDGWELVCARKEYYVFKREKTK